MEWLLISGRMESSRWDFHEVLREWGAPNYHWILTPLLVLPDNVASSIRFRLLWSLSREPACLVRRESAVTPLRKHSCETGMSGGSSLWLVCVSAAVSKDRTGTFCSRMLDKAPFSFTLQYASRDFASSPSPGLQGAKWTEPCAAINSASPSEAAKTIRPWISTWTSVEAEACEYAADLHRFAGRSRWNLPAEMPPEIPDGKTARHFKWGSGRVWKPSAMPLCCSLFLSAFPLGAHFAQRVFAHTHYVQPLVVSA